MPTLTTILTAAVDLDKGPASARPLPYVLYYGNNLAHELRAVITRGGTPVPLTGATVSGYVLRQDGLTVPVAGSVNGNVASMTLSEACYAVQGQAAITMDLVLGDVRTTVVSWTAYVVRTQGDAIADVGVIPSVSEVAAMLEAVGAKGEEVLASIPEDYTTLSAKVEALEETSATGRAAPGIVLDAVGEGITVSNAADGRPFVALSLYGRTQVQDGALASCGQGGTIRLTVGKADLWDDTVTAEGAGIVSDHAVGVALSTFTSGATNLFRNVAKVEKGLTYTLSYKLAETPKATAGRYGVIVDDDGVTLCAPFHTWIEDREQFTFTASATGWLCVCLDVYSTDPALTYGEEPYTDAVQVFDYTSDDGLPGIPAPSWGTWTDADGVQWLSDEIDLVRGVYIQRVGYIAAYAGETITGDYLTATGELVEGAEVYYRLDSPVETALTEAQKAAANALRTVYGGMSVSTDAGTGVHVQHVADTKLYIDSRPAATPEEGAYELIETITLDEATHVLERTQEPDGTPYNFTATYIDVLAKSGGTRSHVKTYYLFGTDASYWYVSLIDAAVDETQEKRWYERAYKANGYWRVDGYSPYASYSTVYYQYAMRPLLANLLTARKNVTGIKLEVNTETVDFPAGSVIKIWGVRANA